MRLFHQQFLLKSYFLPSFSLALIIFFHSNSGFAQKPGSYAIVSPQELNNLIKNDKELVILDVRKEGQYEDDHIPGARNIQKSMLDNDQLDYPGMIAPRKQVEGVLSKAGVKPESHLIIYDDDGDLVAARIWFVLTNYGHKSIQLLDGGYSNWESNKMPVTDEAENYSPSTYTFPSKAENEIYATRDDIKQLQGNPNVIILDVRSDREYSSGHIPGAINLNWVNNLNSEKDFKTKEELLAQFAKAGVTPDKQIITYCRSGTRASHTAFVLKELLGFKNVKSYDGSWLEWSHFGEKVEK